MAEPKTKPNDTSVTDFLNAVTDEKRRRDCFAVLDLMREVTGEEPRMWGSSIVGFGVYRYQYASGRAGDWPLTGFSPRKQNLTLYIMPGFARYAELMQRLGKHKTGQSCLYLNKLEDISLEVLRELVSQSVAHIKQTYAPGTI
jgi:hypothetical protein